MHRVSIKGVLVGSFVDMVATFVFSMAVMVVAVIAVVVTGGAIVKDQAALSGLLASPAVAAVLWAGGAGASILGGYNAARIARHDELLNGALSAWLCVGSGIVMTTVAPHGDLLREILMLPVSPALGLLGGYLCVRKVARGAALAQ